MASVIGLVLLVRHGFIVDWREYPGILNLAVDVQEFHRIYIPRIYAELSCTTVCILQFKWPPIASRLKAKDISKLFLFPRVESF